MGDVNKLKKKGNAAFKAKQYDQAYEAYVAAADAMGNEGEGIHTLHANISAALCGLGKFRDALEAANKSIGIKPEWSKGHVRAG